MIDQPGQFSRARHEPRNEAAQPYRCIHVVDPDFGLRPRQVTRQLTALLGLDALHEVNVRANTIPYL